MKLSEIFRYNLTIYKIQLLLLFTSTFVYFYYVDAPIWIYFTSIFMYFVYGGLGITIMYHKCLTHGSYKTYNFIEKLFSLFAALSGSGSSIAWVTMHSLHHKYSDTESDPHSPNRGGFRVLLSNYNIDTKKIYGPAKKLLRNKFHLFLHNYYLLVHFIWISMIWFIFGINGVFGLYVIPAVMTMLMSYYIIYFCHNSNFGYKNFKSGDTSRNNLLAGYLIFGEGWHNNHHMYPKRANYREKWWEFDISYQIIKLIEIK